MKSSLCFIVPLFWSFSHGAVINETGFEAPEFKTGSFGDGKALETQSKKWSLHASDAGVDLPALAKIQSEVVKNGGQALMIHAGATGKIKSGVSLTQENPGKFLDFEADLRLGKGSNPTVWQFGIGDESAKSGFVGGVNIAPDGKFQLMTEGYSLKGPFVSRDAWFHLRVRFDMAKQSYSVFVDNALVAPDVPFLGPSDRLRIFQFDTFGGGDDSACLDNFSIRSAVSAGQLVEPPAGAYRIWTDAESGRTLEGILQGKSPDGSEATVKRKDNGNVVTLKSERLVEADREFIKTWKSE